VRGKSSSVTGESSSSLSSLLATLPPRRGTYTSSGDTIHSCLPYDEVSFAVEVATTSTRLCSSSTLVSNSSRGMDSYTLLVYSDSARSLEMTRTGSAQRQTQTLTLASFASSLVQNSSRFQMLSILLCAAWRSICSLFSVVWAYSQWEQDEKVFQIVLSLARSRNVPMISVDTSGSGPQMTTVK